MNSILKVIDIEKFDVVRFSKLQNIFSKNNQRTDSMEFLWVVFVTYANLTDKEFNRLESFKTHSEKMGYLSKLLMSRCAKVGVSSSLIELYADAKRTKKNYRHYQQYLHDRLDTQLDKILEKGHERGSDGIDTKDLLNVKAEMTEDTVTARHRRTTLNKLTYFMIKEYITVVNRL